MAIEEPGTTHLPADCWLFASLLGSRRLEVGDGGQGHVGEPNIRAELCGV